MKKQKSAVVKQTQILCVHTPFFSFPHHYWVPLSDTVRLTGKCRRINGTIEKQVEFICIGIFGRKKSNYKWFEEADFRTVEYFQCDEKK